MAWVDAAANMLLPARAQLTMADSSIDVQVLQPSHTALDLSCVTSLKAAIESAHAQGAQVVALDLSSITTQTPQGLAALLEIGLELGSALPSPKVMICGLPRALMACAIDLGMAEIFPIYATPEALRAACHEQES